MRLKRLAVTLVFAATAARADLFGCDHTAQRRVSAPIAGIANITVIGRAGTLNVTGRAGTREIIATGTACSSEAGLLKDIQLRAQQNGSVLRIEAVIPDGGSFFGWMDAKLDFEVTVPDSTPIDVQDGSGDTLIENVGPLHVEDGSGALEIRGVHGSADVRDGSGELTIKDVARDVNVVDGSGSMEIAGVGGNVTVDDGSGSIEVRDVRGDFTVKSDGSGGIDYERVAGRVSIPRRHR